MSSGTLRPKPRLRFQIQDVLGLVVGYAMAALLYRALWPSRGLPVALATPALFFYFWLGAAMSGPIVLLQRPPRRLQPTGLAVAPGTVALATRTWAEWAWLLIGMYWIILGLFVIPARIRDFRASGAFVYGVVPILVACVLRLFGPDARSERIISPGTHLAAVCLLASWPVAWACLIILGMNLR
jgi:hypothetical protein